MIENINGCYELFIKPDSEGRSDNRTKGTKQRRISWETNVLTRSVFFRDGLKKVHCWLWNLDGLRTNGMILLISVCLRSFILELSCIPVIKLSQEDNDKNVNRQDCMQSAEHVENNNLVLLVCNEDVQMTPFSYLFLILEMQSCHKYEEVSRYLFCRRSTAFSWKPSIQESGNKIRHYVYWSPEWYVNSI